MNTDVYKGSIQLLEWYDSIGIKHLFLEDVEVEEIIPEIEEAVPLPPITESKSKKLIEIDEKWNEKTNLLELHAAISPCTKCKLGHTRKNFVFGSGNP